MNARTFGIMAIVAVLLAVLAFVGQRGSDTASIAGDTAGQSLLPTLGSALGAVDLIEISGAGPERLVTLEREDERWTVAEHDSYPAAPGQISALLIALSEATIVEEKTANPAFHSRLGVEAIDSDDATGIGLTLVAGADRFELVLGDSYGSSGRYARLAGSAASVLIDRNPEVARDPGDWLARGILAIAGSRVRQVTIEHADGEALVIQKTEPGQANFSVDAVPEGRELQHAAIANVTGSVLQNLELEDVSGESDTAGEPLARIEFLTFDGLRLTAEATAAGEGEPWIRFTADTADGSDETDADVAAEAAEINARLAGWRFRIPAYQYSQLTRRMEDLLRAPPAAE